MTMTSDETALRILCSVMSVLGREGLRPDTCLEARGLKPRGIILIR